MRKWSFDRRICAATATAANGQRATANGQRATEDTNTKILRFSAQILLFLRGGVFFFFLSLVFGLVSLGTGQESSRPDSPTKKEERVPCRLDTGHGFIMYAERIPMARYTTAATVGTGVRPTLHHHTVGMVRDASCGLCRCLSLFLSPPPPPWTSLRP